MHYVIKILESGGIAPPFMTSALDEGEWSASRLSRFNSGEISPGTPWIGCWMGPRAVLCALEKNKHLAPTGNQIPAILHVARRYTV
jgi:hypothetical protein